MRRSWIFWLGLSMGIVSTGSMIAWLHPVEPTYQGRPFTSWLRDGEQEGVVLTAAARVAIRHMGSNAVPHLLAKLQTEDSFPERRVAKLFFDRGWGEPPIRLAWRDWVKAGAAFETLGAEATVAIPSLAILLDDEERAFPVARALAGIGTPAIPALTNGLAGTNARVRCTIASALVCLGTNAAPVIPALLRLLNDPDPTVIAAATDALGALGTHRLEPDRVVPALAACQGDSRSMVRSRALQALAAYGPSATGALPEVLEALADPVEPVRNAALRATFNIHPKPIALMVRRLEHPEPRVREMAVIALGRHAQRNTNAFNVLTNLLADEDAAVRQRAAAALHSIDRRRATRLRIPFSCP